MDWNSAWVLLAGIITTAITTGTVMKVLEWWSKGRREDRNARKDDRTWLFDQMRADAEDAKEAVKEARKEMDGIRQTSTRQLTESIELRTQVSERDHQIKELKGQVESGNRKVITLTAKLLAAGLPLPPED